MVKQQFDILRPLVKGVYLIFFFLISQPKHYVVGTQKNRLIKTILLSTQNICKNWWVRQYLQITLKTNYNIATLNRIYTPVSLLKDWQ